MKKTLRLFAVALVLVVLFGLVMAIQIPSESSVPTRSTSDSDDVNLSRGQPHSQVSDLDRQKLAFEMGIEEQKLQIEKDKLAVEQSKVRWTAFATVAPFVGVLLTMGFGVWSLARQFKQQAELQDTNARLQFELKAAEILFVGKTPLAVQNRGKALVALFGERLPKGFADSYDPSGIGDPEPKKFFLELLLKHPNQQSQIIQLWKDLFPGDVDWLIKVNLPSQPLGAPKAEDVEK